MPTSGSRPSAFSSHPQRCVCRVDHPTPFPGTAEENQTCISSMREWVTTFLEMMNFPEFKNSEMTLELKGIKVGISDGRRWPTTTIIITLQSYFSPRWLQDSSNPVLVAC